LEQIENILRSFNQIKEVSLLRPYPYDLAMNNDSYEYNGKRITCRITNTYLNLDKILNLKITKGRWFDGTDKAVEIPSVVVNSLLCERLLGREDPLGKIIKNRDNKFRIVGVVEHYRTGGEFTSENPFIFHFTDYNHPEVPGNFFVRVSPDATAKLESEIIKKLQSAAKEMSFKIDRLEDTRKSSLKFDRAPIIAFGLILGFLLIMVSLGLLGVLWLNVSKRTKEIGLRRAKGANRMHIYKQISGEIMVITTIGIIIGLLFAFQFPMLGVFGFVPTKIFILAIFISCTVIYSISYICSIYPSYMATKISPAEALHME
ncbi:ABC transporter permease, partial [candidate division KSB1 bacterium]